MGNSYDYGAALAQAAPEQRKIVLFIRADDGVLEDVWGGPIVPGSDQSGSDAKGSWLKNEGCVYVNHNGWKRVCAPHKMILQIQAGDGILLAVHGPIDEVPDPGGASLAGSWYWKASSPGCTYVLHNGVWKKVCD